MSELDRSRLLDFLSKPRFGREIAEHFNVPVRLVNFHLRKAVRSGHVLISEKPVSKTLRCSSGQQRRFIGFVYVFKNSTTLTETENSLKSKGSAVSLRFLSNVHSSLENGVSPNALSGLTFEGTSSHRTIASNLKTKASLATEFDVSSNRIKLAKHRTMEQLLRHKKSSTQEKVLSLTHVERIRLFQALFKEPLPYLTLHERFDVSKQTIKRLVKNGFIIELWGPRAIGVRFKLTSKGRIHLKELEAAAKYDPALREKPFIRLKHRVPI